jgi:hypothetical protein
VNFVGFGGGLGDVLGNAFHSHERTVYAEDWSLLDFQDADGAVALLELPDIREHQLSRLRLASAGVKARLRPAR